MTQFQPGDEVFGETIGLIVHSNALSQVGESRQIRRSAHLLPSLGFGAS